MQRSNVVLGERDQAFRDEVRDMLVLMKYNVVGETSTVKELESMAAMTDPHCVVVGSSLGTQTTVSNMIERMTTSLMAPVVLMTGQDDRDMVVRMSRKSISGYIPRPFREVDLLTAIEYVIGEFEAFVDMCIALSTGSTVVSNMHAWLLLNEARTCLMDRHQMRREEALNLIKERSLIHRQPMNKVAEAILATA